MSAFFETLMLVCFGVSWPISLYKSYTCRTAVGKSLPFMIFILAGYVAGVTAKLISGQINYVLIFYVLNFTMVAADVGLYFRNRHIDARANGTR